MRLRDWLRPQEAIEVGDHVLTPSGNVTWVVVEIGSKIDPVGVLLMSGMTDRRRYEAYENLTLFQKGDLK